MKSKRQLVNQAIIVQSPLIYGTLDTFLGNHNNVQETDVKIFNFYKRLDVFMHKSYLGLGLRY